MNTDPLQRHQRARFSAAAPGYDRDAHVQRAVADRLLQGMACLGDPKRVLDIGCGTGYLTRRLAETWPRANIVGIDHAPGMIAEARRLSGSHARLTYETADALCYRPAQLFDLAVSSSMLHWLQPLPETMRIIAGFIAAGGSFAFALMLDGTLRELHETRAAIAPDLPPRQRMPAESEVVNALRAAHLHPELSEIEEHRVRSPDARTLLRNLRNLGVTGGPLSRGDRPLRRNELEALCARYEERYRDGAGVFASYRVGYFWGTRDV